jgi:hypothetical protein
MCMPYTYMHMHIHTHATHIIWHTTHMQCHGKHKAAASAGARGEAQVEADGAG